MILSERKNYIPSLKNIQIPHCFHIYYNSTTNKIKIESYYLKSI
jgi:hypothetical protein